MSTTNPVIEIENLRTVFHTENGTVKVVHDVSLAINSGRTLGILGESGSGKSVTALSIMRLLPETAKIETGRIALLGRDLVGLPEPQMRRVRGREISMVFQEPMTSLNPILTIGKQIMEAILLHQNATRALAREKTLDLMREVGIREPEMRVDNYPHQMSGGERQRVMIAIALSCNPKLLIADEPTTALDVTTQAQVLDILRRLRDHRQMSILFITHDLGVLAEIADDVVVLRDGRIVETGPIAEVFSHPQHAYTKGLLACRPRLDSNPDRLLTISDFMKTVEAHQTKTAAGTVDSEVLLGIAQGDRKRLLHPRSELEAMEYPANRDDRQNFVPEGTAPLLEVKNLKVHFPLGQGLFTRNAERVKAVDGVDFRVYRGQTLGLVGESGCGKTTIGRALLRLVAPTAGEVVFDARNFAAVRGGGLRNMRRRMQIIFQDPFSSLNPRMTVESMLTEPMAIHGLGASKKDRRDRAIALLDEVDLSPDFLRRYPHEFSGGQRQRICIARALSVEPELIICDECVSSLDVSVQAQVLNLLNDLKRRRLLTYIFISHDLSVVKFMADMMAVMKQGRFVDFGPSESIYRNPRSSYTKKLIAAMPKYDLSSVKRRQEERK